MKIQFQFLSINLKKILKKHLFFKLLIIGNELLTLLHKARKRVSKNQYAYKTKLQAQLKNKAKQTEIQHLKSFMKS